MIGNTPNNLCESLMNAVASQQSVNSLRQSGFSLPKTPVQGVEICLPEDFQTLSALKHFFIVWSISQQGNIWTRVSQGPYVIVFYFTFILSNIIRIYIPTRRDIGCFLKVEIFLQEYRPNMDVIEKLKQKDKITEFVDFGARIANIRNNLDPSYYPHFDKMILLQQVYFIYNIILSF